MKKYSYFLLLLITVVSCNHKPNIKTVENKSLVSDSVLYATLNYFVNDTLIDEFKNCNRFIDRDGRKVLLEEGSLEIMTLDSLFTQEDLDFIFQQNLNSINFKLSDDLKGKTLISVDTLLKFNHREFWEEFLKRFGKGGFCSISLPLFSKDLSIVIIKYSFNCGSLCASGGTFIYKKMGDKWVEIICLQNWIS